MALSSLRTAKAAWLGVKVQYKINGAKLKGFPKSRRVAFSFSKYLLSF